MPAIFHISIRQEDGAFWATVDECPGVFATGDDLEELRESIEEGISSYRAAPGEEPLPVHLAPLQIQQIETPASAELIPA